MRYMFMLYIDERTFEAMSEAERMKFTNDHTAFRSALMSAAALIEAAPLEHSRNARRIRGAAVEDGPFSDSKAQMCGYYLIEAKDLDAALDWAARCPAASYGSIEIRPLQVWD